MFMFYFINYISLLIFTYICILQPKNLSYGTIRKATLTGRNERYYYCRNDHGKQSGNLGVCICPTSPRIMERFDTDRSGISVLYVHYGSFHVLLLTQIQLQTLQRKRYKNTETDRAYLPGRIRTEYFLTYLLQRILPFRKSTHPGSDATPCTGLWYRFTDRACYQS